MPKLTDEQQKKYFAEEGPKASPLSPTEWLARQGVDTTAPPSSTPKPLTYTADAMSNPASLFKAPETPATPSYRATLSAIPTLESIAAMKTPEVLSAEAEQKAIREKLFGALDASTGEAGFRSSAETAAGLPEYEKQLNDVNAQILQLQNEAQAIPLRIQNESAGRGRTEAGIAPLTADELRKNTIKALGLSAIAQSLQGNVAMAQAQVDRQVEAKYGPIKQQLTYYKAILDLNTEDMNNAQKERATLIAAKLQERQDAVDKAEADHKLTMEYVLKAAAKGAPADVLNKAQDLPPTEALALLKDYMPTQAADGFTLSEGQTRYDANGNPIAYNPKSGGGSSTFSTTQLNKGAANAGMTIEQFSGLDADTQNYFINTFGSSQLGKDVAAVRGGGLTTSGDDKETVVSNVRNSNLSDGVKRIVLSMLGADSAMADTGNGGGGFWSSVGGFIKGIPGIFGVNF